MMQSIKILGVLAAAVATAVVPGAALADSGRNFTISNGNGTYSIQRVWTARAGESSDPWNEVAMKYAIKPGSDSNFTMGTGNVCLYDIKIQFSDEVVQQFDNVNVCRGQTVKAT